MELRDIWVTAVFWWKNGSNQGSLLIPTEIPSVLDELESPLAKLNRLAISAACIVMATE
jgi:hypothetical protein